MAKNILRMILSLCIVSCATFRPSADGIGQIVMENRIWIIKRAIWEKPPSYTKGFVKGFENSAPAKVIYFSGDNKVYMLVCMLYETKKGVFIGREDYNLYYGTWAIRGAHIDLKYKIVPTASFPLPRDERHLGLQEKEARIVARNRLLMDADEYIPLKKMSEAHIRKDVIPPIEYYENTLSKSP